MADEVDPLTQAMIDAGLFPQQEQQLQRRYALGQQLMETPSAQGRQVGQTYVADSPLAHLANAISRFTGIRMMKNAQQGEQDQIAKLGAGRQKYMQAVQLAQSGGQAVGAPDMLARPPDPQRMQQLLMAGAGSGDSGMQQAAHFGMQSQNLERQNRILENTMRHQETMERIAGGRLGVAQEGAALRAKRWNPATQSFVDVSGGGGADQGANGPSATDMPPPGSPAFRALQNEQRQWRVMMDPTAKGSGDLHDQWTRVSQANVLETLMTNEKGGLNNLTSQQQREAATALARMLGAGGGMSEGQVNELDAPSLKRWLAQKQQWLTSAPVGTDAYGIFQNILDTARREKEQAQSVISSTMAKRLTNYPLMRKYQADSVRNVLEGYGLNYDKDFDQTGKYTGTPIGLTPEDRGKAKAAAPAPAATGVGALRTVNGETRRYDGQTWVPIGQ